MSCKGSTVADAVMGEMPSSALVQVQVQVCFSSVHGQVQPLDVVPWCHSHVLTARVMHLPCDCTVDLCGCAMIECFFQRWAAGRVML
jgi:hypothetical protein